MNLKSSLNWLKNKITVIEKNFKVTIERSVLGDNANWDLQMTSATERCSL